MAVKSTPSTENRSSNELSELVAELRADMQSVRKDLAVLAGSASSAARSELSALKQATPESARDLLEKAEAKAAAITESTKKRLASAEETVEAQMGEHPWRTLGIVGLAGFALGLLIRR